MLNKIKNNRSGFTIIEVMIVLAIGALILVVVLIAIPQLQRNQRNSARRDVTARIKAELDNYAGNNNGNYPTAAAAAGAGAAQAFGDPNDASSFFTRYLGCSTTAGTTNCTVNINDPLTGVPIGIGTVDGAAQTVTYSGTVGNVVGSLDYRTGRICNGEVTTTTGASSRNYTLSVRLEGGAVACYDNR